MPDIQFKNIDKSKFSLIKHEDELLHIANTNQYHIIFFNEDCECEVNFKVCRVKDTQVLFLNASDVFICKTRGGTVSQFSFDYQVFDKDHCETQRLINGLLFNGLLSCNLLYFDARELLKSKLYLKKLLSFQAKGDNGTFKMTFKETITQAIIEKHKQFFYENEISKNHHAIYNYLSLVNENFKMEHRVFVYAQILRVQPKILTKIFSDLKINNPKSYLNKRILLAAKKLLAYSTNNSTEVSYEIGFNEPAYFARFFKKNTGITPKQFRKSQTLTESIN